MNDLATAIAKALEFALKVDGQDVTVTVVRKESTGRAS